MTTNLQEWIEHPERLNRDTLYELRTLLARYPYFQTARILYIKNLYLLHDSTFGEELRKAAVYVTDRRVLFYLIEGGRFVIQPQKKQESIKEEPGLDRTLHLIDTFLATVPEEKLQASVENNLSTDYIAYMLREEEFPEQGMTDQVIPLRGQSLIDKFIEKADEGFSMRITPDASTTQNEKETTWQEQNPTITEKAEEETDNKDEESYFTETLAKIYIKQQRYSKALEIIKKLSLKYPKKNAYFADQIKFLEKLIINTKSK